MLILAKLILFWSTLNFVESEIKSFQKTENFDQDAQPPSALRLQVITVASHETDGLLRLARSARVHGLDLQILGRAEWDSIVDPSANGYCRKVSIMRKQLQKLKDQKDLVVLFIDGYDTILTAGEDEILKRFVSMEANVVFGGEMNCWPKEYICEALPDEVGYRGLNSGTIIGYAPYMYQLYSQKLLARKWCCDQLWASRIFLAEELRNKLNLKLDRKARLVQNLFDVPRKDYDIITKDDDTVFKNVKYGTTPVLLHGSGSSKKQLNWIGNYVAKSYTLSEGCLACKENRIHLSSTDKSKYPKVLMGIFISRPTNLLEEMLQKVSQLTYPKENIFLYIFNKVPQHDVVAMEWIENMKEEYLGVEFDSERVKMSHGKAKHRAIQLCLDISCDVFFNVESDVHLENPETLNLLVSYNRSILAPIMLRKDSSLSTFAPFDDSDYRDIITGVKRGIWNVKLIRSAYVIWRHALKYGKVDYKDAVDNHNQFTECDELFSSNLRYEDVFMHAVNLEDFGFLTNGKKII